MSNIQRLLISSRSLDIIFILHTCSRAFDTAAGAVVTGQCSIATGQGTVSGGMAGLRGNWINTKEDVHVYRLARWKSK